MRSPELGIVYCETKPDGDGSSQGIQARTGGTVTNKRGNVEEGSTINVDMVGMVNCSVVII